MINYDELKTALTDISNICRMTECDKCSFGYLTRNGGHCLLFSSTPNNWTDEMQDQSIEQFAARGAHLVEEGYIDE